MGIGRGGLESWRKGVLASAVIIDAQRRVLLLEPAHDGSLWALPSGHAAPKESPGDVLVGIVRRETGLAVRADRCTGVYREGRGAEPNAIHVVFACSVVHLNVVTSHKEAASRWSYKLLEDLPLLANEFMLRCIRDAVRRPKSALPPCPFCGGRVRRLSRDLDLHACSNCKSRFTLDILRAPWQHA